MTPTWFEVSCTMRGKRMVNLNTVTDFFATKQGASDATDVTVISVVGGERITVRDSYDSIANQLVGAFRPWSTP